MLPQSLTCEVFAPSRAAIDELAAIVRTCSHDLHQPVTLLPRVAAETAAALAPVITLHLPVELAASQHPAWCLACRLACFCPQARVSVLVEGQAAFATAAASGRTRRRRSLRTAA